MASPAESAPVVASDADRALLPALRRGEPAAFDEAFARHRARIFGFLRRLAGRRDLAEDLFQETFLQLARHATRLAEDTDLAAWLYTVARNRYRSYRRWALLDALRLRELGLLRDADAPETPFERAALTEGQRRLERALAALRPPDREVLILCGVDGLAPERAAGVLGVRPEAARQRLSRARARLAELLESAPTEATKTDEDAHGK